MLRYVSRSVLVAAVLFFASSAQAQEKGQVGLVMGYPSVGIVWTIEDDFAIRTAIDFSMLSQKSDTSTIDYDTDTSAVGIDVAVLLYDKRVDALTLYISPSVGYRRTSVTTESAILGTIDSTGSGFEFGGALGAQFAASRRFGIYGEAGLSYARQKTTIAGTSTKGHAFGTRAGAGVILYF